MGESQGKRVSGAEHRPRLPIMTASRQPHPRAKQAVTHLLSLGAGPFAAAVDRLAAEAKLLEVFSAVHTYRDFSWVSDLDKETYRDHLQAWRNHGAKIAGFGWWKPVLCR